MPVKSCVLPHPLPTFATGDAEVDELANALAGGGPAQIDAIKRLKSHAKKLSGAALAALLVDDALEMGVACWNEADARKLPAKERRAYQAAFDAAYSARSERTAWLMNVANAAAQHDEGAARLAEIVRDHADWVVRQLIAGPLLACRPDDKVTLEAVATLLSIEGLAHEMLQVRALGARAILRRDRKAAYDELSPLLSRERASEERAGAVLQGLLAEAPAIDDRWLEPLLAILGTKRLDLEFATLAILVKLPPEPRMLEAVLRHAGDPAQTTFIGDPTLQALAHCGDARATPLLLRALVLSSRKDLVLEAIRRSGDPAAAAPVRAFVDEQKTSPYAAQLGGTIDLGEAVIRALELRGHAAVPAVTPAAAPPTERERRRLSPSSPRELPDEVAILDQRKELESAFAAAGLSEVAGALIRTSIRLFSTRSEDAAIAVGASKLGGCPDLPRGVEWPRDGEQVFSFVAQLALGELSALDSESLLPKRGLLSFFIQDEYEEPFTNLGVVRVLLSDGPLERREVPVGFDRRPAEQAIREPFAPCTLRAVQLLVVPSASSAIVERLVPKEKRAAYEDSVYVAFSAENQLLGYRDNDYDAHPEETQLLFQCISDDEAGMEWGDVQELCFVIQRDALAAGDFSSVVGVVGP